MIFTTTGFIRNLPLAKKLTLFCVITSLVSLIIAMTAIILYDRYNFQDILENELTILSSVLSNRSGAAVIFDDASLAENNLSTLKLQKTIVAACIYKFSPNSLTNKEGQLANYPNNDINCPSYTPTKTLVLNSSNKQFIEIIQPIYVDDNIIGYLYLKSNTKDLQNRQTNHVLVMLIVSFIASMIAYSLARTFSKRISRPLSSLKETARIIAEEDDYTRRAEKLSNDEVGQVVDSFNQMLDVIEQEDANLRESEEKFRLISTSSKVGIFQLDDNGLFIYANEELSIITGLPNENIINSGWLAAVHEDDQNVIKNKWQTMLESKQSIHISCRLKDNGKIKWISGSVGLLKRQENEPIGYLGTITDISDIKNAQVQLEQMAFYDTLTGLANRRLFRNRLEYVTNNINREGNKLGLILLDLDNFKNINDSLGHDAGDSLLTTVAERLQLCVRASDTVARLGGDEFAIILPGINNSIAASNVAEKVLEVLRNVIHLNEIEIRITASAGISMAPDDSQNAEELIKNADLALYRAKDHGRNNYQFFTTQMNTDLMDHLQLIKDLRLAVDNNEFSLAFQPQLNLKNGTLTGFEALIRWQHPQRGPVSPVEFIPAAEETGLIIPLGRWVITAACAQLRSMIEQELININTVMTVNLSIQQFQDEGLVKFIDSQLKQFKLAPQQFEVELTETVLMENLDQALLTLEAIKQLGILISIDDFGTGYSSLGYLKRLPVNIVKVDRSFVMDIPHDKDDMEITAAVIAMAHNLNYEVVAEGVETEEQLQFLESCGCDYGQGYYFSRPLPAKEIEEFCRNFSFESLRANQA
ncbi:EAL domain-containing protein [Oceanicoccus sp. KOV_DT_Chl]|uniref:bifunctional diguanylate cyclase/phosphodiesterase n=1 Tax=Oceanicoccus sp. KOV_DT_Chl TaxID=1904639 RepID=UPI000C7DD34B|nr:EAL domain-containing protein [Oceanicoccus sp. KOV_DT_Chl]